MFKDLNLPLIVDSTVEHEGTAYGLVETPSGRRLAISGVTTGFSGENVAGGVRLCPLTAENAAALRARLPWLRPVPLGLRTSAGFGDRLGVATPGHVQAVRGTGVGPIFAQQSVRENARTGRTPQQVMDDALWGVFQAGWCSDWGADADHMKTTADIDPFVSAGYTFFTIDPGDHVDDAAETDDPATRQAKAAGLDWDALQTTLADTQARYPAKIALEEGLELAFGEGTLLKALAKYGAAIVHTARMAHHLRDRLGGRPFEMEMSVDETGTTTTLEEHFFIASELRRLEVPFVSLAPRFVGRFEKGVDYIGDLVELEHNIAGHTAIMRHFGGSYKLSLHTGSDKFSVYPIAAFHAAGLVHLKTAGTSYLEALRLMSTVDPALFRTVLDFSRAHYDEDRRTYHVSAVLDRVPAAVSLTDAQLPDLLNQFDARQALHVTFGSVLDTFGNDLCNLLHDHEAEYHALLRLHFDRHLQAFRKPDAT